MNLAISALSGTFSQILDIAKYDSGEYRPELQPIELRRMLSDIEEQFGGLAHLKGLELRVRHLSGPPYYTTSDYEMLWRILSNLVSNAIKFTPSPTGSRHSGVLIGATRTADRFRVVCLRYWDWGSPREHFAAIWEPFFQVANRERNREKG